MRNKMRFVCALGLLLSLTAHAGGIKKWVDEDGNVHFGDIPPPNAINTESVKVQKSIIATKSTLPPDKDAGNPSTGDYYSPQNQLRRMEAQNEREQRMRMQRRSEARSEELSRQQKKMHEKSSEHQKIVDKSKCDLYEARANEQEHKIKKGYSSDKKKLEDISHLATLNRLKAEYCR